MKYNIQVVECDWAVAKELRKMGAMKCGKPGSHGHGMTNMEII